MSDIEKNKVTDLEIIARIRGNHPYYEIKYKKIGENWFTIGYGSFDIKNVSKWKEECFEIVEKKTTNADRIRNMSDEELAKNLCLLLDCRKRPTFKTCNVGSMCYANLLEWLRSEAE